MLLPSILIIAGFVLLIKGADWMVSGASSLAKKYNISDLAIGLTVVAFGTSAPELVVNSVAAYESHSDIVFGNIIGSNNFNLFMILGIVGLIFPIVVQSNTVWKEIPISMLAILVLFLLANPFLDSSFVGISRLDGSFLLILFASFIFYVYRQISSNNEEPETSEITPMSTTRITILIIAGMAGLIVGGKLVVDNAIDIATTLGVSEKIIGLTIIAAGTSLPELVTSVVAAFRKNSDIAIGNIIGSNIFNIFLIIGISSLVKPIAYSDSFNEDMYFLMGGTIFLFAAMFMSGKKKLDRWEAGVLLIAYIIYNYMLISSNV